MNVDALSVGSGMWSWIGEKFGSSMFGGDMCIGDVDGGAMTSFGAGCWNGSIGVFLPGMAMAFVGIGEDGFEKAGE